MTGYHSSGVEFPLLPCPFCGSTQIDAGFCMGERNGKNAYAAGCWKCEACGPFRLTLGSAGRVWNRRAQVPQPEQRK